MKLTYILFGVCILFLAGCTTVAYDKTELSPEMKTISLMEQEDGSETVIIKENKVYPVDITVKAGTLVVWKNIDGQIHTLASYDGSFLTKSLNPGDVYSHTFNTKGEFEYFSIDHKGLQGRIIVTE